MRRDMSVVMRAVVQERITHMDLFRHVTGTPSPNLYGMACKSGILDAARTAEVMKVQVNRCAFMLEE